ncbi:TPA: hypothetical protein DEG21_03655 [Patescibacteria group bacterium]|nr:hypothetical protein [Candidatus Gracilibacteria bacterium]HBY74948.1 hypothetical protein [Candidatus Gracilibacteria bacterium]
MLISSKYTFNIFHKSSGFRFSDKFVKPAKSEKNTVISLSNQPSLSSSTQVFISSSTTSDDIYLENIDFISSLDFFSSRYFFK